MRRFGPKAGCHARALQCVLPVASAVLLLVLAGAGPAAADEIPPPVFPSGLSSPSDVGNDAGNAQTTPGPTYEITPGSPGTELPAPEDAQVRDARAALDRLNGKARKTQVAAPATTDAGETRAAGGANWWLIGSGLLVLLVLTELGRVNLTGARHKRRAERA